MDIVIPTYRRIANILRTYDQLKDFNVLFVCHESDIESQQTVRNLGLIPIMDYQPPSGVNATNRGYWAATSSLIVIGQDDFNWHDGWLEAAEAYEKPVVGFNDGYVGHEETQHSVGWLVNRAYVEIYSLANGFPNSIFCPLYKKNYADDELNETVKNRGMFAYARDALVEHLHPGFGKAPQDDTYAVLDQFSEQDHQLYLSRKSCIIESVTHNK